MLNDEMYEAFEHENSRKKRKHSNNKALVFLGIFFSLLIISMLSYIGIYSYSNAQTFVENKYNTRASQLKKENSRGSIISSDGVELAITQIDDNGNENRVYPYKNEFAHVVGYSKLGGAGIENQVNYYLINCNSDLSTKAAYSNAKKKFPGDNVYVTLNSSLQRLAYYSLGQYNGAVIISNPKTGEILAMVSKPDFDPNTIADDWNTLSKDKENAPLLNRATQGLYPPGSTFKILTSLEYIRENPTNFMGYSYMCHGSITKDGNTIKCYHGQVHGKEDFTKSFAVSCNSSYSNIGLMLNQTDFAKTLDSMLFNAPLPVDFASAKSRATASTSLSTHAIMQLSIGQGATSVSPLHMNMITMAIANDGILKKPYQIDRVVSSDGNVVKKFESSEIGRIMSENEAEILTQMMRAVVTKGTASSLKNAEYEAVGKTGSAEFEDKTRNSHAWFTGFAPANDPQICVTVIMENAGSGGHMAVPVAKRIFDEYFKVNTIKNE